MITFLSILILAAGALTLAAFWSQKAGPAAVPSASALTAPETSFDFATISMKNGKVSHRFEIKNNGADPINILKVATSCMCTTASVIDAAGNMRGTFGMPGHTSSQTDIKMGPGETAFIEAVFDPAAHGPSGVGLAERSVFITTNSHSAPDLELRFRAIVTP